MRKALVTGITGQDGSCPAVERMCAEMVTADLAEARGHALLKAHGHHVSVGREK